MYFEAKHEYCEALSVCVQRLQIWVRHNSPSGSDELGLQFVSIFTRLKYFRMVHSEPMDLFVGLAESFVYVYFVYYFCSGSLLLICYWLHRLVT